MVKQIHGNFDSIEDIFEIVQSRDTNFVRKSILFTKLTMTISKFDDIKQKWIVEENYMRLCGYSIKEA